MSTHARETRKRMAHLGDWPGDEMVWRVSVVSGVIIARRVGRPGVEASQSVVEWLQERTGYSGATAEMKEVANV